MKLNISVFLWLLTIPFDLAVLCLDFPKLMKSQKSLLKLWGHPLMTSARKYRIFRFPCSQVHNRPHWGYPLPIMDIGHANFSPTNASSFIPRTFAWSRCHFLLLPKIKSLKFQQVLLHFKYSEYWKIFLAIYVAFKTRLLHNAWIHLSPNFQSGKSK